MTELDFDELDKAVSTLMSGVDTSKRKAGYDDPEEKVVTIPSADDPVTTAPESSSSPSPVTESNSTAPITSEVAEAPTQDVQPEARPSEPLAVKRRGQFMDVIHPSSDMKSATAPRREGVSLQPSSPFVSAPSVSTPEEEPMSEEPSTAPVVDIVTPAGAAPASASDVEPASNSSTSAWPDPIDLANKADEPHDNNGDGVNDTPSQDTVPDDVVNEIAEPEAEQPIASPFLADAKVEKRPLGTATPFPESVATPDAPISQEPVVEQLPEELNTDVMALESSNTSGQSEPEKKNEVPEAPVKPEASAPVSNIPGSIPQQYAEQKSSSEASNSAIYDTSTHHQPLDAGVKKSSPMKWVVLGLVLLIVGALAGAAYFYFTTQ